VKAVAIAKVEAVSCRLTTANKRQDAASALPRPLIVPRLLGQIFGMGFAYGL
jgi:hypothetical protein